MIKQKSFRSAKTGRFVSKKFASRHKGTTYLDTIKKKKVWPKRKESKYPEDEFNEG